MTTRLGVYNQAARFLGQTPLSSVTEARPMRVAFDAAWDDALAFLLEHGLWSWAKRAVLLAPSASVVPSFGYSAAYPHPDDWVSTDMLAISEFMTNDPLKQYEEENGYWFTNTTSLYVRYISNDADYGGNLSHWTAAAAKALGCQLAVDCSASILQNKGERNDLFVLAGKLLSDAKSHDQRGGPVRYAPTGRLVLSRSRGFSSSSRGRW